MPAQHNAYQSIASSGSFVMRASIHNRDRFSSARDDLSHPYPSYEDVYLHSNMSNPGSDEFQDLGLNDFLVAQRRVARRKLEHLQLTPYQGSLFSRGIQPHWEQWEPYNVVLEASIRYAASCGVVIMDEVVDLNERVDVRMEEVEGDVRALWELCRRTPLCPLFLPIYCKTSCPKDDVKLHNYALSITTTTRGTCLWSRYPVLVIIRELEALTSRPSIASWRP